MKQVGIVRRIDELGRVVVPKEIRKYLKIESGDFVEINLYEENIVLTKFHMLDHNKALIIELCESINKTYQIDIIITNIDKILFSSISNNIIDEKINSDFVKRINSFLEKEISSLNKVSLTDNYIIDKDFISYEINVNDKFFGYLILLDKIIGKKQKDIAMFILDYLNKVLKD